jgi:hypothetical protein
MKENQEINEKNGKYDEVEYDRVSNNLCINLIEEVIKDKFLYSDSQNLESYFPQHLYVNKIPIELIKCNKCLKQCFSVFDNGNCSLCYSEDVKIDNT